MCCASVSPSEFAFSALNTLSEIRNAMALMDGLMGVETHAGSRCPSIHPMSDTIHAFFERLARRGYEPLLHSVSGTIQADIQDTGSWFVILNKGELTVSRDAETADCVIACRREDFERMVVGKQNPMTLFMQGKMQITGNVVLAQMFQRLFPDESLTGDTQE